MSTPGTTLQQAFAHFQAGRIDQARRLAETVCGDRKARDMSGPAHQLLGVIALKEGSDAEAVRHLQQALAHRRHDPGLLLNLAIALISASSGFTFCQRATFTKQNKTSPSSNLLQCSVQCTDIAVAGENRPQCLLRPSFCLVFV